MKGRLLLFALLAALAVGLASLIACTVGDDDDDDTATVDDDQAPPVASDDDDDDDDNDDDDTTGDDDDDNDDNDDDNDDATPDLGYNVGDTMPDFTLTDSTGAEVSLTDYDGQVVLLDSSAMW